MELPRAVHLVVGGGGFGFSPTSEDPFLFYRYVVSGECESVGESSERAKKNSSINTLNRSGPRTEKKTDHLHVYKSEGIVPHA